MGPKQSRQWRSRTFGALLAVEKAENCLDNTNNTYEKYNFLRVHRQLWSVRIQTAVRTLRIAAVCYVHLCLLRRSPLTHVMWCVCVFVNRFTLSLTTRSGRSESGSRSTRTSSCSCCSTSWSGPRGRRAGGSGRGEEAA